MLPQESGQVVFGHGVPAGVVGVADGGVVVLLLDGGSAAKSALSLLLAQDPAGFHAHF